jgi:flagellar biosynthetic protein FliR
MEQSINELIPGLGLQNIMEMLLAFFLTSIRLSAFIIASPFFSARFIMLRVRIIIAFVISIIVFSIHPLDLDTQVLTSAYGIAVIFKEIAIGVSAGLILSIMFSAVSLAGEKIATSAGLSYAAQVDPVSGVQTPVVSQILYLFLIMLFLTVDGHLVALRIIIESYNFIPIGTLPVPSALIDGGMAASGSMFLNASIIMMPVVLVVLLINVAIGIITRSAPQLNLFSFGFPITMLGTFIVLYFSISNLGFAFSDLIDSSLDHLMTTLESISNG